MAAWSPKFPGQLKGPPDLIAQPHLVASRSFCSNFGSFLWCDRVPVNTKQTEDIKLELKVCCISGFISTESHKIGLTEGPKRLLY